MENKIPKILLFFIFIISINTNKIKTESQKNLNKTINKNKMDIDEIYNNIKLYEKNNKLFNEMKQIIKNYSLGNELFEEEYHFLNIIPENMTRYDESLEHRLIPEILFEFKNKISCFNFIQTKPITKDDTGHFVSILLLICQNNSIIVSDLLGNIYLTYETEYEINEIVTFNQNDINDFYIVTKNFTEIKKFLLLQGLFYKNNNNTNNTINNTINKNESLDEIDNVIDVETYAEDLKREKVEKLSYKLVDTYKQNIKEQRIKILEEKNIYFNLNNNSFINNCNNSEYIININPVIIKGVKSLIVITNKKSIYKLNNQNFQIISYSKINEKNINNFSNTLNPVTMTSFYILFNKNNNGFKVSKIDNTSFIITKCELFPDNSTEKIKYYYFDQKSRTLYILSNLFNIYLVTPMLIQTSNESFKNSCRILFLCKLNKIIENNNQNTKDYGNFYLSLLNKKLMITNNGIDFEVVDLTKIGEVDNENKLNTKIFSLEQYINENINLTPLILKNNNLYLLLYQINNNSLLLFNYHEKNSKIYTSEPQSFNFKVPIILVAFIVILIWNYIKKKNENNEIGDIDLKGNTDKLKHEEIPK